MRSRYDRRNLAPDCKVEARHKQVIELIADVRQRHRLAELARYLDISPSRLEHVFKFETGVSLRTFSINLRLHHAAAMLTKRELAIKTVLYDTGFSHPANFSHLFRRHFGMTATKFKDLQSSQQETPIECACQENTLRLIWSAMRLL
jgi:AraC family transcriptional regulator of arabinose operon